MRRLVLVFVLGALACSPTPAEPPPPMSSTGATEDDSAEASDSTGDDATTSGVDETAGSSTTGPVLPDGIPPPTAPCPIFEDGVVTFCPAGLGTCRDALVANAEGAAGGPLALYWHGTFESPDGLAGNDVAVDALRTMVAEQDGLMVMPYADPEAEGRPEVPFPWWVVCGDGGSQCDREDDFVLADEIIGCAVEAGLVDHERLGVAGMSAGGVMTSHLVGRKGYFAAAVSFSGGIREEYRPLLPPNDTAVMAVHGGPEDLYCDRGVEECYSFVPPTEALAFDVDAAGNFAFVCDHTTGHVTALGSEAAGFLSLARAGGHPWEGQPFGGEEHGVLQLYCYSPSGERARTPASPGTGVRSAPP